MNADPFEQPYWNLDQCLIWLASRDPAAVLNATDCPNSRTNQPIGWREYLGSNVDRQKVEMEAVRAIKGGYINVEFGLTSPRPRDGRFGREKPGPYDIPTMRKLAEMNDTDLAKFMADWRRTPDDPEEFADWVIEFEGEPTFAALLMRTTNGMREKVRPQPQFNPQSIRRLYPAPTPSNIRDRPDVENPVVGPFIAYHDAWRWLAECSSLEKSLPIDEADSHAEKTIRYICMNTPEKLTMWGFCKADPGAKLEPVTPQDWQGLSINPLEGQPEADLKALGFRREYGAATKGEYGPEIWTGLCFDRKQFVVAFVTGAGNGTKRVPLPNLQIANSDKSRAAAWALRELYGTNGYPRTATDQQLAGAVNTALSKQSAPAHFQGTQVSRDTIRRLLGRAAANSAR
jgi:hypothetical protein